MTQLDPEQLTSDRSNKMRTHKLMIIAGVFLLLTILIVANARLVAVAFKTQPDCVLHSKPGVTEATGLQAAKSSC